MPTTPPPRPVRDPRSALHLLLALAFRRPTPERFAMMQDGRYADAISSVVAALPHLAALGPACDGLRRAPGLAERSLGDLEAELPRLFDASAGRGLHERDHRGDVVAVRLRFELEDVFAEFKVVPGADGGRRLAPDHLSSELALLSQMCFLEATGRAERDRERVEGCLVGQRDLLAGHLTRWVPSLAASLARSRANGWFAGLAALAAAVLEEELRLVVARLDGDDDPPADDLVPLGRSGVGGIALAGGPPLVQLGVRRPAVP